MREVGERLEREKEFSCLVEEKYERQGLQKVGSTKNPLSPFMRRNGWRQHFLFPFPLLSLVLKRGTMWTRVFKCIQKIIVLLSSLFILAFSYIKHYIKSHQFSLPKKNLINFSHLSLFLHSFTPLSLFKLYSYNQTYPTLEVLCFLYHLL
jgi:hypothetical protein